jgi:hypothetical protein
VGCKQKQAIGLECADRPASLRSLGHEVSDLEALEFGNDPLGAREAIGRPRSYGVALYDDATKKLRPLTDEEAAILLNRDPDIAREWRKWNAMTQNEGTLATKAGTHDHVLTSLPSW